MATPNQEQMSGVLVDEMQSSSLESAEELLSRAFPFSDFDDEPEHDMELNVLPVDETREPRTPSALEN